MKDIKTFIIGFLTCACLFLVMGYNSGETAKQVNIDFPSTITLKGIHFPSSLSIHHSGMINHSGVISNL